MSATLAALSERLEAARNRLMADRAAADDAALAASLAGADPQEYERLLQRITEGEAEVRKLEAALRAAQSQVRETRANDDTASRVAAIDRATRALADVTTLSGEIEQAAMQLAEQVARLRAREQAARTALVSALGATRASELPVLLLTQELDALLDGVARGASGSGGGINELVSRRVRQTLNQVRV